LNAPTPIGVGLSPEGELKYVVSDEPVHLPVETTLDSWQLDDEWWRQRISRRYVAVMLEGGKRMLLFEDLITGEWYEQTP
jgi:hypothetical protein